MRAVVCNLLMAAVTIPGLFGWCCHPSVDEASGDGAISAIPQTCCCHHDDEAFPAVPDDSCSQCKGVCTYVLTSKVRVDSPGQTTPLFVSFSAHSQNTGRIPVDAGFSHLADQVARPLTSLRTHVIHQLWLI